MKSCIWDFFYPDNIECIICKKSISKKNTYSICKECYNSIKFIEKGCLKCGKPLSEFYSIKLCPSCERKRIQGNLFFEFERAFSCVEYNKNIHRLIYKLKYSKHTYIAKYMADIMAQKLEFEGFKPDYITFIPLNEMRYKKRGFNQSLLISKNLAEVMNIQVLDLAIRIKNTNYLSKLSKQDRKNELIDAFRIRFKDVDIERFKSKNILVVDDIFTTGGTLNEFSKTIRVLGFDKIYAISFATGRNIF